MKSRQELEELLYSINGRGYPAYKKARGSYLFSDFILHIHHIQSDPFAAPSDVSVEVRNTFPETLQKNAASIRALEDFLIRFFGKNLRISQKGGSGKSGQVSISRPGAQVLSRTACKVSKDRILVRFHIGFPAHGRRIDVQPLIRILFRQLPQIVSRCLLYENYSEQEKRDVRDAVWLSEDQQAIRRFLKDNQYAAFAANGSILPRSSGDRQEKMENARPFVSPKSLEIEIETPHSGIVKGMGIPAGITLIAGGGYHGKSTLLDALQEGVYDHIAGDGREFVICDDTAVKIRAEDGRSVQNVNISPFIQNLPQKKDTGNFSTQDASGSTSQAANVMEALEAGSKVLLMDEDTSATNFLIRDPLMQRVVSSSQEPIIPYLERVQALKEKGISTILVAGSSGSYFKEADLILQMDQYEPFDITEKAKEEVQRYEAQYPGLLDTQHPAICSFDFERIPEKSALFEEERIKTKTTGLDTISFKRQNLDVRYLEQLVDPEQLKTLAAMIVWLEKNGFSQSRPLREAAEDLLNTIEEKSLDFLSSKDMAMVRKQELMGALSRLRNLKIAAGIENTSD